MKKTRLSIIAASAALGAGLLFTGCGSSSDSSASSSSITPVKGYILEGTATATNGTTDKNGTMTNGKFVFAGGLTSDYNVTIDAGAWVDADESGDINKTNGIDLQTLGALKTTGASSVATSLTTYAVEQLAANPNFDFDTFMAQVKDIDPVASLANADDDATAALIMMASVLDELVITGADLNTSTDMNISAIMASTADDFNASALGITNPIALAKVASAKAAIKLVKAAKEAGISAAEIKKLFVQLVDAKLPVDTVMANIETGDVNTTAFNAVVDTQRTIIDDANDAVEALTPAVISLTGDIKLGSETVTLTGSTFTQTLDINSSSSTLADFYNIEIPAKATKEINATTADLCVKITDNTDTNNTVTATITGATIAADENGALTTTLNTNTTVSLVATGIDMTTGNGSLGTKLTNTDLAFNASTVINAVGSSTVASALEDLNAFLVEKSNSYTVKFSLQNTTIKTAFESVSGTVSVVVDGETAAVVDTPVTETPVTETPVTETPDDGNTTTGGDLSASFSMGSFSYDAKPDIPTLTDTDALSLSIVDSKLVISGLSNMLSVKYKEYTGEDTSEATEETATLANGAVATIDATLNSGDKFWIKTVDVDYAVGYFHLTIE